MHHAYRPHLAPDVDGGGGGARSADADGQSYVPLLVQSVLVFEAGAAKLRTCSSARTGAA